MMQSYPFWVFDASGVSGNVLFSIFDPVFGFSSCSAPEISAELKSVRPGNWEYPKHTVKAGNVNPVTLARGARFYDSDFYIWMNNAIKGIQPIRRTLVLVQFLPFRAQNQIANVNGQEDDNAYLSIGLRTPGRVWVMYNCVPTRYKAGSDFDATSSAVSIAELEMQPEYITESTIATVSPATARAFSSGIEIVNAIR